MAIQLAGVLWSLWERCAYVLWSEPTSGARLVEKHGVSTEGQFGAEPNGLHLHSSGDVPAEETFIQSETIAHVSNKAAISNDPPIDTITLSRPEPSSPTWKSAFSQFLLEFDSPELVQTLVKLQDNEAQELLDRGHEALTSWPADDELSLMGDVARRKTLRHKIHRLVVRLIQNSKVLPSAMKLDASQFSLERGPDTWPLRIGYGAFSDVYKGSYGTTSVAVKKFRNAGANGPVQLWKSDDDLYKVTTREFAIQQYLDHPNICRPLGLIHNGCDNSLQFVYPYMENLDVVNYVKTVDANLSVIYRIFYQIALALAHTHDMNVTHGDLHAHNILIDQAGNVQLTDFGVANFADSTIVSVSLSRYGAARWMAPEILAAVDDAEKNDKKVPIEHSPASDVFSFGMCMLQILTRKNPYSEIRDSQVQRHIINGNIPSRPQTVEERIWRVLCDCWRYQPNDRPETKSLVPCLRPLAGECHASA